MLVDDPARRSFVGSGQGVHRFLDVLVDEHLEAVTLVSRQKRVPGEDETRLLIIEVPNEMRDALRDHLLLTNHRGRGVGSCRCEIAAV